MAPVPLAARSQQTIVAVDLGNYHILAKAVCLPGQHAATDVLETGTITTRRAVRWREKDPAFVAAEAELVAKRTSVSDDVQALAAQQPRHAQFLMLTRSTAPPRPAAPST